MSKLRIPDQKYREKHGMAYMFHCPGCGVSHIVHTEKRNCMGAIWTFNGDMDKPTFSPSVVVKYENGPDNKPMVCHSFIRDGKFEYLSDCTHKLAGQTFEMENEE